MTFNVFWIIPNKKNPSFLLSTIIFLNYHFIIIIMIIFITNQKNKKIRLLRIEHLNQNLFGIIKLFIFITAFDGNFVISLVVISFIDDMHKFSIIQSSAKSLFIVIFCFPTNTPQVEGKNCLQQNIHYHGFYISISQYFQKNLVLFVFHFSFLIII